MVRIERFSRPQEVDKQRLGRRRRGCLGRDRRRRLPQHSGSSSPPDTPAFPQIPSTTSCRCGPRHQRVCARRAPARRSMLEGAVGPQRAVGGVCRRTDGIICRDRWERRACLAVALESAQRSATQFDSTMPGFSWTQATLVDMAVELNKGPVAHCTSAPQRCRAAPRQGQLGK